MIQDSGTSVWRKCTVFSKIEVEKAHTAQLMTFDMGSYRSPKSSNGSVVRREVTAS